MKASQYRLVWLALAGLLWAGQSHSEPWRLLREAEQADAVVAPAHIVPNPQAREGKCVMLSEGGAVVRSSLREKGATAGAKTGELDFTVDLPKAGSYRVWVRAQWHCVCSNSFYLLTTGTPRLEGAIAPNLRDGEEPYRVKASVPPRAWRWLLAATCDFSAGEQKLRLIQAGHEALIDALMLASDPADLPPGYEDQSRIHIYAPRNKDTKEESPKDGIESVGWTPSGTGALCPLGRTDWTHFQLDLVVPPDGPDAKHPASWGIEFARQPNGAAYSLLFSHSEKETLRAQLDAINGANRRVLASYDCGALCQSRSRWVRVIRLDETIKVAVDGTICLETSDTTFAGGTMALVANNAENLPFQGVQIKPLDHHLEHFQAGTADWRAHAGTWRAVKTGGNEDDPMACAAKTAAQPGLLAAPWNMGAQYELTGQLQLSKEGSAGFAYEIEDAKNYATALLHRKQDDTLELQLQRFVDGKPEQVHSRPANADPRQWHTLRLARHSGFARVELDGVPLAKCPSIDSTDAKGVGLALGNASECLFGQVDAQTRTSFHNDTFLVEGPEAPITLCQWKPAQGSTRILGHPAVIFLSSQRTDEQATLRLDRELTGDLELEVSLYKYSSDPVDPAGDPSTLPELALPPLPNAPQVAIVFHRTENGQPVDYALQTDWESVREAVLLRNGQPIERAYADKPGHPEGYKIFLKLTGNTLSGGIAGISEIHTTLPTNQPDNARTTVSITTRNFAPHDEAGIVEMRLCN
ncbi:MAG: hypothetical protein RBU21_14640 [FCB group bacterium]|jgi:hypothetical protein|nr:hypothetical protein [FCB group bacterium]